MAIVTRALRITARRSLDSSAPSGSNIARTGRHWPRDDSGGGARAFEPGCRLERSLSWPAVESPSPIPVVTRVDVKRPGRNGSSPVRPQASPSEAQAGARNAVTRERVELPPERRLSPATLAGLAAAAGIAAIVLGGWAFVSGVGRDGDGASQSAAPSGFQQAVALLARPDAERLPLHGAAGRITLVVQPSDDAALVLNGLGPAESGWAYQAWVTSHASITPRSAGLFSGRDIVVPLATRVPPGATVAVTLEPATGSFAPSRRPKLVVERPLPSTRAQPGARARNRQTNG